MVSNELEFFQEICVKFKKPITWLVVINCGLILLVLTL